jgi:signal transduction histidine kinase
MKEKLKILLADDEEIIRRRVCLMLADRFCIDQADTARGAREAATSHYDAVLLDIVFPDGNGIEICKEIKERDPHRTVVISSSMESVDAWDQAFRAGADGYFEKRELLGLDPRKIALTIENLVERNRLRRQAEELNRRQGELLSVLSHDVRAPFQALLGTIELLRKGPIPPSAAENVETLFQCAKDQLAFINSLLEFLRLESGMIGLRRIPLDVNLPVNQCLQGLRMLASSKGITLEVHLEPTLPKIPGDIGRIGQLASNLLSNAVKFTARGGTVIVRTAASTRQSFSGVEISVEDNGIGIKPEDRERIFQRFHRGRSRGTEGERGTGLGLSICREIAQLHQGHLDVFPGESGGSRFAAWFPVESESCVTGQTQTCEQSATTKRPARSKAKEPSSRNQLTKRRASC